MIGAAMTTNPKERDLYGDFPWKCMFHSELGGIGVLFCGDREDAQMWVDVLNLEHPNPNHPFLIEEVKS